MRRFFPCILALVFLLASVTAALSQEKTKMSGRHVWHTMETLSHEIGGAQSVECYKRKGVGFINETDETYTITNLYCLYFFGDNILGGGIASVQSEQGGNISMFHLNTKEDKRVFSWLSGTGVYEGISGEGTFETYIAEEGLGYTDWRGEYTIVQE